MNDASPISLLLIEDEDIVALYLQELLEESGRFNLLRASSLQEGLLYDQQKSPNVILLDLGLPDSTGLDTLHALLNNHTSAAIIIMTGTADEELASAALQQGAQDYLVKGQSDNTLIIKSIHYALERKQFHDQLQQSHRQMLQSEKMASIGQLAAGVAHEINNPMGFITSNLHTLHKYTQRLSDFLAQQSKALASHPDRELLDRLNSERKRLKIDYINKDLEELINESLSGAQRVIKIVENLRSFSRTDQHTFAEADLNTIIADTVKIIWNELKYKCTLHQELEDLPLVPCYPHQLGQVFMNLLLNAAQAIEQQGDITVKTFTDLDQVRITITDTGAGIAPEAIGKIFDPFFTTKPPGRGTGLGLSIVYDIITNKHHGTIDVVSEVGVGTTFTITLPIHQEESHE